MTDAENFFGGGGTALKFPTVGTTHVLTITDEPEVVPQTDFDTGEPLFWPDGKPREQMVLRGTVDELEDGDDDGERRLFVKSGLVKAIGSAMREAKTKAPAPGGVLTVTYVKDGPKPARGYPAKVYEASYTPPVPAARSSAANFLGSDEAETPAAKPGPLAKQIADDKRGRTRAKASVGATSEDDDPPPF